MIDAEKSQAMRLAGNWAHAAGGATIPLFFAGFLAKSYLDDKLSSLDQLKQSVAKIEGAQSVITGQLSSAAQAASVVQKNEERIHALERQNTEMMAQIKLLQACLSNPRKCPL